MELRLQRMFQHQIQIQCEFALESARGVDSALSVRPLNLMAVFYGIQNLLNASANIRKSLWGSTKEVSAERKSLRDSLQAGEHSVLFARTTVRNHNEHFDERIDRWWLESADKSSIDMIICPRNAVRGFKETDCFRWYDPITGDVMFWGDAFNLPRLVDEIKRLHPIAAE